MKKMITKKFQEMECIPPWLSSRNQCYKNFTKENTNAYISGSFTQQFIDPPNNWKPTAAELKCEDPCEISFNQVSLVGDLLLGGISDGFELIIEFDKVVKIERKVVVYTWFEFIIDGGSSLGLWLGLSALGLTDLALHIFHVVKNFVLKVNSKRMMPYT